MLLLSTPNQRALAQGAGVDRRGGPHDWSHSHVAAAAGGITRDGRDLTEWRAVSRHRRMEQAKASRANRIADLFNTFRNVRRPAAAAGDAATRLDWSLRTGGTGSVEG